MLTEIPASRLPASRHAVKRPQHQPEDVPVTETRFKFVGRREELSTLNRWLGQNKSVINLFGPPGIGKTALIDNLAADGGNRQFVVLRSDSDGRWFPVEQTQGSLASLSPDVNSLCQLLTQFKLKDHASHNDPIKTELLALFVGLEGQGSIILETIYPQSRSLPFPLSQEVKVMSLGPLTKAEINELVGDPRVGQRIYDFTGGYPPAVQNVAAALRQTQG